jgi:hypothetical protein
MGTDVKPIFHPTKNFELFGGCGDSGSREREIQ